MLPRDPPPPHTHTQEKASCNLAVNRHFFSLNHSFLDLMTLFCLPLCSWPCLLNLEVLSCPEPPDLQLSLEITSVCRQKVLILFFQTLPIFVFAFVHSVILCPYTQKTPAKSLQLAGLKSSLSLSWLHYSWSTSFKIKCFTLRKVNIPGIKFMLFQLKF